MTFDRDEDFLKVGDIAKRMEMSVKTVRGLIRAKRIPAERLGRSYYVHWPSVRDRLASQKELTPLWWREDG